jgi:hypothetical protein
VLINSDLNYELKTPVVQLTIKTKREMLFRGQWKFRDSALTLSSQP